MRGESTFEMPCEFLQETEKAVLIHDHVGGMSHWIPLSQVEEMHYTNLPGQPKLGTIVMAEWLAREKGFME